MSGHHVELYSQRKRENFKTMKTIRTILLLAGVYAGCVLASSCTRMLDAGNASEVFVDESVQLRIQDPVVRPYNSSTAGRIIITSDSARKPVSGSYSAVLSRWEKHIIRMSEYSTFPLHDNE